MKKAGIIRKVTAFGLDIGMSAGAGFLLMWPLGTFEVQEAYEFNQIILRIIFLIVASFLIMRYAWSMRKIMLWQIALSAQSSLKVLPECKVIIITRKQRIG